MLTGGKSHSPSLESNGCRGNAILAFRGVDFDGRYVAIGTKVRFEKLLERKKKRESKILVLYTTTCRATSRFVIAPSERRGAALQF